LLVKGRVSEKKRRKKQREWNHWGKSVFERGGLNPERRTGGRTSA